MESPFVRGVPEPGGHFVSLPPGSLTVSEPRELTVTPSIPAAYGPDGIARDTLARDNPRMLVRLRKDDLRGDLASAPLYPKPGFAPDNLPAEDVVAVHEEPVVWGGGIHRQYGHFLVESTARLWPLLPGADLEGLPVVFAMPWTLPFGRDWLDAFGARVVQLPEQGAVRFTKMLVPEPAWRIDGWIAPELRDVHLHAREGLDVPPSSRHDVLWLSRANLSRERAPYDELLLEFLLGDHVTSIRPETMTLAEQVAALEGSRAVAGVRGSAFHTLLLTKRTPESLYLCPPWDKGAYPAQHRMMGSLATFAPVLTMPVVPAVRRKILSQGGAGFPGGYRISIPATLRALRDSVLPTLFEDQRIAAFADPERHWSRRGNGSGTAGLDAAVAAVLLEPHSIETRAGLGEAFAAEGLGQLAEEQLTIADDLGGPTRNHTPASHLAREEDG